MQGSISVHKGLKYFRLNMPLIICILEGISRCATDDIVPGTSTAGHCDNQISSIDLELNLLVNSGC